MYVQRELDIPVSQALALFAKLIRKVSKRLIDIRKAVISAQLPQASLTGALAMSSRVDGDDSQPSADNVAASMEAELDQAGSEVTNAMRERQKEMIDSLDLKK